jgi:Inositol hexakisphosphate
MFKLQQVSKFGTDLPMVFNCQMGAGRTTTGTVIGGLIAMHGMRAAAGSAAAAALVGAGDAPSRVLLSVPSCSSLGDLGELGEDILREELAGDSPRHSGAKRGRVAGRQAGRNAGGQEIGMQMGRQIGRQRGSTEEAGEDGPSAAYVHRVVVAVGARHGCGGGGGGGNGALHQWWQ